jgi:hypothetical protein
MIIIDATYLQFIRDNHEIDAPEVFVGTREDLIHFFTKHRKRIFPQGPSRASGKGLFDPVEFVDKTYFPNRQGY